MRSLSIIFILATLFGCQAEKEKKVNANEIRISGDTTKLLSREKLILKRSKNRLYDGAPPVIPHTLEQAFTDYQSCMNCHHIGSGHGPNVLHSNQVNCTQCHVRVKTKSIFMENTFTPQAKAVAIKRANPIGPPYIPHRIQDRENCQVCHIDSGAKIELIPRHGNLINCTQCHVQLQTQYEAFSFR